MKKKFKLFFVFTVMVIVATFTMTGCAILAEAFKVPEFPSDFTGTWERVDQSKFENTLTFTSTTLKASNQDYNWVIERVSGDLYYIRVRDYAGKITVRFIDGNLAIIDGDANSDDSLKNTENNWTGTWRREIPNQKFDSAEALKEYLDGQPENNPSNLIKVIIDVNDLMFKDIVDVIKASNKYISLNLSGNALTTIEKDAFNDCRKLIRITIPDSVTNINTGAFSDCTNLTAINVSPSNTKYCSKDGILFSKDMTILWLFPQCNSVTQLTLYTDVAPYAFYGSNVTNVTLAGGGLTDISTGRTRTQKIYEGAFINCTSLIRVQFGSGLLLLEKGSFDGDLFELWDKASTVNLSNGAKGRDLTFEGTFTRPNGMSMTWTRSR